MNKIADFWPNEEKPLPVLPGSLSLGLRGVSVGQHGDGGGVRVVWQRVGGELYQDGVDRVSVAV